jgi:hypothetical protein
MDPQEKKEIYSLICCFAIYKWFLKPEEPTLNLSSLSEKIKKKIKKYFPQITNWESIPNLKSVRKISYEGDWEEHLNFMTKIAGYKETILGDCPFDCIWQKEPDKIIEIAHVEYYEKMNINIFVKSPGLNYDIKGVFVSHFYEELDIDCVKEEYRHYLSIPKIKNKKKRSTFDTYSWGLEESFVEVFLHGINISKFDFTSLIKIDNKIGFSIFSEMSDLELKLVSLDLLY